MTKSFQHLSKGLFVLAVVGGLIFGSVSVAQGVPLWPCGSEPGELGECPPFTDTTCEAACILTNHPGGECMRHEGGPDCCVCMI